MQHSKVNISELATSCLKTLTKTVVNICLTWAYEWKLTKPTEFYTETIFKKQQKKQDFEDLSLL